MPAHQGTVQLAGRSTVALLLLPTSLFSLPSAEDDGHVNALSLHQSHGVEGRKGSETEGSTRQQHTRISPCAGNSQSFPTRMWPFCPLQSAPDSRLSHTHPLTHLFCLSEVKPEPPPGTELLPLAEVKSHVGAGVARDEGGAVAAESIFFASGGRSRHSHEGAEERLPLTNSSRLEHPRRQQRTVIRQRESHALARPSPLSLSPLPSVIRVRGGPRSAYSAARCFGGFAAAAASP